ncbi:hypothetical protein HMPREF0297_2169 [Corynebacterium jeikeium ATCC 43734]|nr:hypothetical protein HMPREF0297_2169 [Corynebacterium jeikeium ATCC 43734]
MCGFALLWHRHSWAPFVAVIITFHGSGKGAGSWRSASLLPKDAYMWVYDFTQHSF